MSQTVDPKQIEKKLTDIWRELEKTGQMRACLFNLILYSPLSKRTDYIKQISQKVLQKFPCRIILINHDPEKESLESSVSVIPQDEKPNSVVCDYIEINVGTKDLERASFLILPHLLPDLPIYMLWGEEIDRENPLYSRLEEFCTRTIFDSECTKNLSKFTKHLLDIKCNIADLNWGRIEAWKNLFVVNFQPCLYLEDLKKASKITIYYNSHQTESFKHCKIQALYFHAWLADRLNWEFKSSSKNDLTYQREDGAQVTFSFIPEESPSLKPATIISIKVEAEDDKLFELIRSENNEEQVLFHASTKTTCDVPNNFWLEKAHEGQSLVKEIYYKGTSRHFLSMLKKLQKLPGEVL